MPYFRIFMHFWRTLERFCKNRTKRTFWIILFSRLCVRKFKWFFDMLFRERPSKHSLTYVKGFNLAKTHPFQLPFSTCKFPLLFPKFFNFLTFKILVKIAPKGKHLLNVKKVQIPLILCH